VIFVALVIVGFAIKALSGDVDPKR
jgi:hypothetical protein